MMSLTQFPASDPRVIHAKVGGGGESTARSVLKIVYAEILTDLGFLNIDSETKEQICEEIPPDRVERLKQDYYTICSHAVTFEEAESYMKLFYANKIKGECLFQDKIPSIITQLFSRAYGMKDELTRDIQHAMESISV